MKAGTKLIILSVSVAVLTLTAQAATLTFNGGTAASLVMDGVSNPTSPHNSNSKIVALIEANYPSLTELYKSDGSTLTDSTYSLSYSAAILAKPIDSEDFTIKNVRAPFINSEDVYVLVKDGNNSPYYYFYNISGWNGKSDIVGQDFWPGNGGISYIGIWAGPTTNVADGGVTIALLGLALSGVGLMSRKFSR